MTKTIYPLVAGALPTETTTAYNPSTHTQFTVSSSTWIPSATNHLTLRYGEHFVTIQFTSFSNSVVSGITYVEGDQNYLFPIGTSVLRTIDKYDFDAVSENITAKVDKSQGTAYAGKYLLVGDDGNVGLGDAVSDYPDLTNKPSVNSVILVGNKTSEQLGIVVNLTKAQYDALSDTEKNSGKIFCTTDEAGGGGGSGGTTDYEELENKPKINSVELIGNKSLSDLGIASASDLTTHTSDSTIHVTASDKTTWNGKADVSDIPTALSELTADATHRLVTDAEKTVWTGKQDAITSTAKLSADLVDDSSATNKFFHTHASTHALNGGDAVSLDASQVTTGIFSADRIPALAYQRMVTVADETAKSALTSADVNVGDTVYVQDNNKLYIVSSITGKGTSAEVINYVIYTAYVSWNSITGKPSSYTPSAHASTHVNGDDDIQLANTSQKGLLSSTDWNTFNAKQSALTFDSTPTASSTNPVTSGGVYTALAGKQDTLTIEQTPTTSTTAIVSSNGVKTAITTAVSNKVRSGTTTPTVTGDEVTGDIYVKYS